MFVSGCVCVLSVFGESFVGLRRLIVGPQLRRCGSLTPHTPRLPPVSVCVSGCGTGAAHFPGVGHWRPQSVSGGRLGSGPLISSWLGDLLGCGGGRPGLCLLACWPGRVCRLPPACPARCAAPRAQRLLAAWAGASAWAAVILASTGKPAALPSPPPPPPPRRPGRSGCGATSPSRIPGRGWSLCFRAFSACISSSSCWHWPPGWLPPSWLLGGEAGGLARPGYTHTATRVHIASSHRVTWIHTHSYTGTHTASHRVTWAHTSHTVTYTVTPIHSHMQSHTSHSADSLLTSVAPSQA